MDDELHAGLNALAEGLGGEALESDFESTSEQVFSVLVVDDRLEMRRSLTALIDAAGYLTTDADSGPVALATLESRPVDLMVLDLVMPGMSGFEVIDAVRERGFDTRIIVVSGETSFEHVQSALTRGAVDFVQKPYEPEALLSTLERVCTKLRLERRNQLVERRLSHSELLHRFIVDSSPDLVYMVDREGRFAFLNARAETLLGIPRDELLGKHYSVLLPKDQLEAGRYLLEERRTGDRASRNVELRLRRRTGAQRPDERRHDDEVVVEITAMGVYVEGELPGESNFIGTYGVARDITDRKRAQELINFQAYHDLLTHLPNRALLRDRLEQALGGVRRSDRGIAVMFLDLDRFKAVNDTLGHTVGDRLLRSVAARLRSCVRQQDTLARFGGDEFCILLTDVDAVADVETVARKILDHLVVPFLVDEHELAVGASIGIALYPEGGTSAETLIQNADSAMYHAKARGTSGYRFFRRDMREQVVSRFSLATELRAAVERGEFEPWYQPEVDLETGQVVGLEALVRWHHPRRGVTEPGEFVAVAEEAGLMPAIDEMVQRKACAQMARWRASGHPQLALALNVSAEQVEQEHFVERLLALLDATMGRDGVRLEINDRVVLQGRDGLVPALEQLAAAGLRVGLDDFGTGHSSLVWLERLPVDTLKIHRTFVAAIDLESGRAASADAVVHLARGLGLELVAEGVEDAAKLRHLYERGCRVASGYVFVAPATAGEIEGRVLTGGFLEHVRGVLATAAGGAGPSEALRRA